MNLLGSLFEIVEVSGNGSNFSAAIKISADHIIYKGHFPGHPVTPGVILIQIVQELVENQLKKSIRLKEMPNCKFLKIVNPDEDNQATLSIVLGLKNETLHVKAVGTNNSGNFLKLSALYFAE